MAKVVKFCAACEEGFAEKFGFCPNCGGALAAYELNPIADKTSVGAAENVEAKIASPVVFEDSPVSERNEQPVTETFSAVEEDELLEINGFPQEETAAFTPAATENNFNYNSNGSDYNQAENSSSKVYQNAVESNPATPRDDGYHITFVEEKSSSNRTLLMLGAFLLVTTIAFGAVIQSLFDKNLLVGSLNGDSSMLAYVGPVEPEPIEIEEPKPRNKDDGGGGGGGGKENPEPATKGRLPNQVDKPIMPPQPLPQVTNASLPNPNETQGNIKRERTSEPVGVPAGSLSDRLSSGSGTGGGIGSGSGTGVGTGRGTGEGSGIGSGSGSGIGSGNGGGRGSGDNGDNPPPPKPKPVGPTVGVKLISQPKPPYTDAARQNQVTGVVRLRVTFLASGEIGSVSPISGLSYGLTEQAISAAKRIRFEPAKVNGVPQTVAKTIEYTFTIY